MFNNKVKQTVDGLDGQLETIVNKMAMTEPGTAEYASLTEQLKGLKDIRGDLKPAKLEKLKADTLVNGAVSIATVLLVLKYEKFDIVTSKAFGIATKLLGR